jgi:hypothetical protein
MYHVIKNGIKLATIVFAASHPGYWREFVIPQILGGNVLLEDGNLLLAEDFANFKVRCKIGEFSPVDDTLTEMDLAIGLRSHQFKLQRA